MPTDNRRQDIHAQLLFALSQNEPTQLPPILENIHSADLADFLTELDEQGQQAIVDALNNEQAAELLGELEPEDRARVLDLLSVERASDILEEMPTDEAADLLGELTTDEADAFLQHMEPDVADDVADLLRYSEDSAGGLMTKEFVCVSPDQIVADVLTLLRRHHDDAEMIYYIYILDEDAKLLGVVTLRKLIVSDPQTEIADIMAREFVSVPVQMPQDEVAEIVRRHDLLAVPVLDHEGRMLGMITVDDIGDVVQEEASEDLLEMGGSSEADEKPSLLTLRGWKSGFLVLLGGVAASLIIWALSKPLAFQQENASLLPFLLILSVTAGSQAAISMDRAYENAVERQKIGRILLRELEAGALLALIGMILAGTLAYVITKHTLVSVFPIAVPLGISLWVASAIGAFGALVVRRKGGWLGTTSLTTVIILVVLIAVTVYLLLSHWWLRL